jgi:phage terminase large subunit-like protein
MWNTKPRCPWQTKEYYASEQQILSPSQFDRIHRNQWVTSTETFVPMEWWHACAHPGEEWPKIDKTRQPMVIALDAAVSDDTFGMWMGHRHPTKMEVMTEYARRWKPVQGHKIDFQGTAEKPGPEFELRRLIKNYNVVEVAYDPYQLHDMASRLKVEGLAWFREFPQGADRLTADSQFRALIRERRFWHHGEEDFTEHIQNANAKVDIEDRRLRIVKRMEKLKIDLAVAASMGSSEILRLNL